MDPIYFVLGGIFSWVLLSTINLVKPNLKRYYEKKRIEIEVRNNKHYKEKYGDIEEYLDDSLHFQKSNFLDEMAINGLKPLIILAFATLFYNYSPIGVIILFAIFIFFILHEFLTADLYKGNCWYRLLIIIIWVLFCLNTFGFFTTNEILK